MGNVNIKFNGKDYLLACDDGQEENLKNLGKHIDKKFENIKKKLGNIGENKLMLINAIQIADDFFALNKKVKKSKSEFEVISNKFKELRSLAIEYKNDKDQEIQKLNQDLENLRSLVEESKSSYENLLDKTTKSIEDFLEGSKNLQ
jgi:cell division protein ZapA|tara:strand:- start:226 stop:663 length:438 start_codon:yes stop_codon:yes gene_type:complete